MALVANPFVYDTVADMVAGHLPSGYTTTHVNGFAASGDGGAADYVIGGAGSGAGQYTDGAANKLIIAPNGPINLLTFGADPTGVAASDTAFANAIAFAISKAQNALAGDVQLVAMPAIYIPAGQYLFKVPWITSSTFASKTAGVRIYGDGPWASSVFYEPTSSGPLIDDNSLFLFFRLAGLSFSCNDTGSDFLDSHSTGAAQDFAFDDVTWRGSWQYGVNLTGSNTNSEHKYDRCFWSLSALTAWHYVGSSGTSNQFVNYWFKNCKYWSATAPLVETNAGGHFHLADCDFSGYSPGSQTYLFSLLGASGFGVQAFYAERCRFELQTADAGVMECGWGIGSVVFDKCDFSSQAFVAGSDLWIPFAFALNGGTPAPMVSFRDSLIMGQVQITYNENSYNEPSRFLFDGCEFVNQSAMENAFVFVNANGSVNPGGAPLVNLRNCRVLDTGSPSAGAAIVAPNATLNWETNSNSAPQFWTVIPRDPSGLIPLSADGNATVQLPVGSRVTNVRFKATAGHNEDGGNVTLNVTAGDGTVVATSGALNPYLNPFDVSVDTWFPCGDILAATLTLSGTGESQPSTGDVLITYLG